MQQASSDEQKYVVGTLNETIDQREAKERSPLERWHEISELEETIAIDVICDSASHRIIENSRLREIVGYLQSSAYVKVQAYPEHAPSVKLYFRKNDGFIMAGRLYIEEGVILSPEGPVIKLDSKEVKKILDYADCNQNQNQN